MIGLLPTVVTVLTSEFKVSSTSQAAAWPRSAAKARPVKPLTSWMLTSSGRSVASSRSRATSPLCAALKKSKLDCKYLKKALADLQKRRKLELEGYGRDVAELRKRLERVKRDARKSDAAAASPRGGKKPVDPRGVYDPARFGP